MHSWSTLYVPSKSIKKKKLHLKFISYYEIKLFTNLNVTGKVYPLLGKGTFVSISFGASTETMSLDITVTVVCNFILGHSKITAEVRSSNYKIWAYYIKVKYGNHIAKSF